MRIVFMGTPDIAAVCLDRILKDGFEVAGVYTQPDRPRGRGMKLTASPVKVLAMTAGIPVFQPDSFREEETVEQLRALKPDIGAGVAYAVILVLIGIMQVHNYTLDKTLQTLGLTFIAILIIIFLCLLLANLIGQVFHFFRYLYIEIIFRA